MSCFTQIVPARCLIGKFLIAWLFLTLPESGLVAQTKGDSTAELSLDQAQRIYGVEGAEDIVIDQRTGMAFISADPRPLPETGTHPNGALFALNLNARQPYLRLLTPDLERDFHPGGLSLHRSPEGQLHVFVINHHQHGEVVEIYEWNPRHHQLTRVETITQPDMLYNLQDLEAVGPRQFYAVNDHGSTSRVGRWFENMFRMRKGNIVYCDGQSCRIAAEDLTFPNGIQATADGQALFVSSTLDGRLYHYDIAHQTGALTFVRSHRISTGLDNINMDESGNLWICAHPNLLKLVRKRYIESKRSPWKLYQVVNPASPNPEIRCLTTNRGKEISAVNVAATWKHRLLLGSVFSRFLVLTPWQGPADVQASAGR